MCDNYPSSHHRQNILAQKIQSSPFSGTAVYPFYTTSGPALGLIWPIVSPVPSVHLELLSKRNFIRACLPCMPSHGASEEDLSFHFIIKRASKKTFLFGKQYSGSLVACVFLQFCLMWSVLSSHSLWKHSILPSFRTCQWDSTISAGEQRGTSVLKNVCLCVREKINFYLLHLFLQKRLKKQKQKNNNILLMQNLYILYGIVLYTKYIAKIYV